jgi:hypothetical protein
MYMDRLLTVTVVCAAVYVLMAAFPAVHAHVPVSTGWARIPFSNSLFYSLRAGISVACCWADENPAPKPVVQSQVNLLISSISSLTISIYYCLQAPLDMYTRSALAPCNIECCIQGQCWCCGALADESKQHIAITNSWLSNPSMAAAVGAITRIASDANLSLRIFPPGVN